MHFLVAAEDGIHRAGFDAFGAADAPVFDDEGDLRRCFFAVVGVEWFGFDAEQFGDFFDAFLAAGRALVDVCFAFGNGFGVGFAAGEAALAALGLRQDGVDFFGKRVAFDFVFLCEVAEQQAAEGDDAEQEEQGADERQRGYAHPPNPMKAIARMPAVISAAGVPLKGAGTSAASKRSRRAAKMMRTRVKPTAAPKP